MVPAVRSGLDIAFWLLERAGSEGASLTIKRLMSLLYLAQGEFAGRGYGMLMPAAFAAFRDGPMETTVRLALEAGLQNPWPPEIGTAPGDFLGDFWLRMGALPQPALDRLISADGVWSKHLEQGEGAAIAFDAMATAYLRLDAQRPRPAAVRPAPSRPNPLAALRRDDDRAALPPLPRPAASRPAPPPPAPRAAAPAPEPSPRRPAEEKIEPFTDEDLRPTGFPPADMGFTTDGRPIARWKPRRRVE